MPQTRAFGDPLWEQGLALGNQGDIDKQQIAGALSTSTHGSGKNLGSFSSSLRWVKLINGYGEIVEIGEGQLRELRAARVALGTLGFTGAGGQPFRWIGSNPWLIPATLPSPPATPTYWGN